MANDALFQHFLRHVFPYFYVKYKKLPEGFLDTSVEPFVAKGFLTENLFDGIEKAMFAVQNVLVASWCERLEKDKDQMTSSAEKYISQTIMFCYALKSVISDIYERFITVCALVTLIGTYICYSTRKKFYQLTPQILTVFFEDALKEDFKKRGGWKRLERYLLGQDYLEYYEIFCVYINCNEIDKRIALKHELLRFFKRLNFLHSSFFDSVQMGDQDTKILTSRVLSFIEASLLTELALPISTATSNFQETSISSALSKLSLEINPELEYAKNSKVSEKYDFDVTELFFHPLLADHLLNLKKLVSVFYLNSGSSILGASLKRNVSSLIMYLTCFQLNLEQAILQLDIAQIRIRNVDV
ncbi:uncharacterized protein TNCT_509881 [Trichonephila clavata]|uniref:Uncharacterized protein n=1 Tax=Trichonephila clavata TaxID=2740835 RepID=A0A8X6JIH1_TRICU|nr:uncharacterized protein TNCT_509881 [Trichonephila clavata]